MQKRWKNDFFLKILSVFCAVLLWLIVINIQYPKETIEVKNIPIKLTGTENYVGDITKDNEDVLIKVKGSKLAIAKIKNGGIKFTANADMKYYPNPIPVKVAIQTKLSELISIEEQDPYYIKVSIQNNETTNGVQ